jgi:hypothetical protein
MPIHLIPGLIVWAVVVSGVLLLAMRRWKLVRREGALGGLHVAGGDEKLPALEADIARRLASIDFWGKALTILAAVLALAISAAWLYHGWFTALEVVH